MLVKNVTSGTWESSYLYLTGGFRQLFCPTTIQTAGFASGATFPVGPTTP
ncbi:MAG: hypothetical protein IPH94_15305 [Saprospiraceae bacterium]|nr:hypothetical protein [Saprospiraceae bacterium]